MKMPSVRPLVAVEAGIALNPCRGEIVKMTNVSFNRFAACCATSLVAMAAIVAPDASASISGVCPDGSMFIVQRIASVPCRGAKTVEPSDVPPLKPEFLPRPHGWEVHNRRNDPNNPYNLIDSTPIDQRDAVQRTSRPAPRETQTVRAAAPQVRQQAPAPPAPPMQVQGVGSLGLADAEISDLATIVELSQRNAPAAILSRGTGGRVQLARSQAFESRLRESFAQRGQQTSGNVVLFRVDTEASGAFWGNLTFVQGHIAYQPDAEEPTQLGLIRGNMGELGSDEAVLGYVVIPDGFDLSQPVNIYWNDLQITATLTR